MLSMNMKMLCRTAVNFFEEMKEGTLWKKYYKLGQFRRRAEGMEAVFI